MMFDMYLKEIQSLYSNNLDEITELTFRTPLENLLKAFVIDKQYNKIRVIHEAKKQTDKGKPDFKVKDRQDITIGYIETKPIDENLEQVLNSKQLDKYRSLSENIIVTDYLRFILIRKGKPIKDVTLLTSNKLQNKKIGIDTEVQVSLEALLTSFFENEPEPITNPKDLAIKLSDRAKYLREFCLEELEADSKSRIDALFDVFKESLIPDLEPKYFADIYAQTITYGLFLAFLNCENVKLLNERTAYDFLPKSYPLIKELFHELEQFPPRILWAIDEILSILKSVELEAMLIAFSFKKTPTKAFVDPYIYFYEDFLSHYDKKLKTISGVFYTPEPIVSFIVRSIEKVLRDNFKIYDGFINKQVTVLDFACGTGTFLVDVFRSAIQSAERLGDIVTVQKEVNNHMLPNFYGFELLVAPYIVAHLKISQFLKENNCEISTDKRLNIFLTNTLSNTKLPQVPLLPSLTKEGELADRVKNEDILIILGNPPYNNRSSNKTKWIIDLIKDYKPSDEKKLNLNDDYIKFIRFAHWKMQNVEHGIVGIITNNSFLSGITHRKMRGMLINDFDEIYILNLHGNSRIGETCQDGTRDDNVFKIKQGVAITFLIKDKKRDGKSCKVYSHDLYGLRNQKYETLNNDDISVIGEELPIEDFNIAFKSTKWGQKRFKDNLNFFVPITNTAILEYGEFWGITEIFKEYNSGIQTKRDGLTIHFSRESLKSVLNDFRKLDDEEIRAKYHLPPDGRDWTIQLAKENLTDTNYSDANYQHIHYRPFDIRWTYFTDKSKGFLAYPRYKTMVNYTVNKNYGLSFSRQVVSDTWQHVFVTSQMPEGCLVSIKTREWTYNAPLYIYKNDEAQQRLPGHEEEWRVPNLHNEFIKFIYTLYDFTPSPEQITGYIYAIFHSITYREKYYDFLKIDFPRVPFSTDVDMFLKLSTIGQELIEHHLMKTSYSDNICQFSGTGTNYRIEKVAYKNNRIYINKDRYFSPVTKNIWDFYIGGYQVLDHWLKERKGENMDIDAKQFIQIANIINNTLTSMKKIDSLTSEWI